MYSMVENCGMSSAGWFTSDMPPYEGGNYTNTESTRLTNLIQEGSQSPLNYSSYSNPIKTSGPDHLLGSSGSKSCMPIFLL